MNEEMQEILIANLTLDTYRKNNIPPLVVPQDDYGARVIRVNVTDQGKPVSVESTAAVSIVATRSGDGESLAFSGKVNDDGSVTVPVTQWMLDIPDEDVICHVVVTGNGYQYSTTSFLIEPQEKVNPAEITPDDPRVDVVTQVIANENARQAAEATRTANENARKTAENARQSAETQRLTDEATRVANEQQRVSAEASRDATFKSWANDIALLPDMSARISRNSKRLDGLEQRIKPSPFVFDETVAYQKDVPSDAVGAAEIHKIGGMTYKDGDTLKYAKVTEIKSVGVNLWEFGDSTFDEYKNFKLKKPLPAGQYTIGALISSNDTNQSRASASFLDSSGNVIEYAILNRDNYNNVTITYNRDIYAIRLHAGTIIGNSSGDSATWKNIQLNKGSTALPYTPYVEHSLPIPEAVQALDGYGFGVSADYNNHIELDKKQFVKMVQTVVLDGTELWHQNGGSLNQNDRFGLILSFDVVDGVSVSNKYTSQSWATQDKTFYVGSKSLFIRDSDFTSVADFKAHLAELYAKGTPLIVVFALSEPIVTDISDLITSDNLIGVEGDGTLTFENEYGYAVPSTVEYITAESDE